MNSVEKILIRQVADHNTPSIQYLLFDKDRILHKLQHGLADIKKDRRVDDATTYHLFSITKTITALSIMQLAEKGSLDIQRPVIFYLPEFPYGSATTVKQLLTHTAGIPNPIPLSWIHSEDEHEGFAANPYFGRIFEKHRKAASKPNERFAYSNLGYFVLGQLIEKLSNQKYEDYVTDNIIKRLKMSSSQLSFKIVGQHATGYNRRLGLADLVIGLFVDKSKYMKQAEGRWRPYHNFYPNGVAFAGLMGTPVGLASYLQELLKPDCRLISSRYKQLLFQENSTNDDRPTGMCLSWFKGSLNGNTYFAHAGGGGGYYCEIRLYPAVGLGSVIVFNRTGMSDERFLDRVDRYVLPGLGVPLNLVH